MTSSPPRPPHEALRRPLGLSRFWIFLASADLVVKFEKRAIREMRDAELDAWLADFSLESLRTGLSRFERELMAFRVRKLPCDDDEVPSPRTAAQEASRLPQKMPQKTFEERAGRGGLLQDNQR
jgi:hypothetical protein